MVKCKRKKGDQLTLTPLKATGDDLENTADTEFTGIIVDYFVRFIK